MLDIDSAIAKASSFLKPGIKSEQVKAIKLSQGHDLNLQALIKVLCWWCCRWSLCMMDQVERLLARGVSAAIISSNSRTEGLGWGLGIGSLVAGYLVYPLCEFSVYDDYILRTVILRNSTVF